MWGTVNVFTCSLFPEFLKPAKQGIKALGQLCLLSEFPGNVYSLSLENSAHIPELQKCKSKFSGATSPLSNWTKMMEHWWSFFLTCSNRVAASVEFKNKQLGQTHNFKFSDLWFHALLLFTSSGLDKSHRDWDLLFGVFVYSLTHLLHWFLCRKTLVVLPTASD